MSTHDHMTLKDDTLGEDTQEKVSAAKGHDDSDTLVIDWEGPDDPENPKKCIIIICYCYCYLVFNLTP